MRLSLSLSVFYAAVAYDPSSLKGILDPALIAKIEGYMPPICSQLYGDRTHWSDWSNCSATCGLGEQVRYLNGDVIKDMQNNGCEIQIDKQKCTGTLCPQDCLYNAWSEWGYCEPSNGIQSRTRTIQSPAINGGKDCDVLWGPTTQTQNCAVDCDGKWSEWSTCSGKSASSKRVFDVSVRALNGGKACPSADVKSCNPACQDIAWTSFSECDESTGMHTRTRDVPLDGDYVAIKRALKKNECPTIDTQPCDIDCQLSDWKRAAACDASTGTRPISRTILQPSHNCGKPCNDLDHDTLLTSTETCAVDCKVSEWSKYTCDISTGVSTSTRSILVEPLNGGNECGDLQRTNSCLPKTCGAGDWTTGSCSASSCTAVRTREMTYPKRDAGLPCDLYETAPCTLDAVMGPWTDWSSCDKSGHKFRSREIVSAACNGGKVAGHTKEVSTCEEICNDINNPWNKWGPCNQATGIQTRSRTLITPPTDGETVCLTTESQTCAVNCAMDNWSKWSKCDECTGLQNRTRNTLQPMLNGGNQCGASFDTQDCGVACLASEWTPWTAPDDSCTCTSTREEIAPALNNGPCELTREDPTCSQNCIVSDWSVPGDCHLSGPHAGFQFSSRSVTQKQCNSGAPCPDTEQWTTCDIDCELGDWSEWSKCDLKSQTQTSTRNVLQKSYSNGAVCGATTRTQQCGACADLVTDFKYTDCDKTTGTKTGVAHWLFKPRQNQQCTLEVTEKCLIDCKQADWKAGVCHVKGPLAGQQKFTRDLLTAPLNGGQACDDDSKLEPCTVDCKTTDQWGAWSDCDANGFQQRSRLVDYPAQHGGSNADCQIREQQVCAVDCVIDPTSGLVAQISLNGGQTCKEVAKAQGLPGDYSDESSTTISFLAKFQANKEYTMAALATGGVGLMFVVGLVASRRQRNGYDTISRPTSV